MPLPALDAILKEDCPFHTTISNVGVNGLSGISPNFVFDLNVKSKPFFLNGLHYYIRSSLRGSFNMFHPHDDYKERFKVTEEQIDQQNKETLAGIFDSNSEHFAFDRDELKDFFDAKHFLHFARNDASSLHIRHRDIQIPEDLQTLANEKIKDYLKSIEPLFYSGELEALQVYRNRF